MGFLGKGVWGKHNSTIGKITMGVVIAGAGLLLYKFYTNRRSMMSASANTVFAGTAVPPSFAGVGRVNAANPGLADDGPEDNQVNWTAAGSGAGLDPSAYSDLTLRNEEVLYSHLPHDVFSGAPAKNFEAMKFQGSFGLTGPPGQGFFTYF